MNSIPWRWPRAGTLLGVLALAIAGFGGVTALRAGGIHDRIVVSDPAAPLPSNLTYVEKSADVAGGDWETMTMDCGPGRGIISGGVYHTRANLFIVQGYPRFGGGKAPYSWGFTASNVDPLVPADASFTGTLICAKFGVAVVPPK